MNFKIRKGKIGDERDIAQMFNEGLRRKNYLYTGADKQYDKKRILKMRKMWKNKDQLHLVCIDQKTKKVVGQVSAYWKNRGRTAHRTDLGWRVHPDYQGNGIGTLLLNKILLELKKKGFKRVQAECATKNIASWKMARKNGFKIEGTLKGGLKTDEGKLIDTYLVGRLL
ncbi:GNAT family N-acetyltransferase [Candidatus Pacearchaeota archaeon]|nr:GNAT family N-acetyltransferase [Candidatus Pacearchaeota archaeon]